MMRLLHIGDPERGRLWQGAVQAALPEVRFDCWPEVERPDEIRHVEWASLDIGQ